MMKVDIEHRLSSIETDMLWIKKLNWLVFAGMITNLMITIIIK